MKKREWVHGSMHFNYKLSHSTVLLAVVDASYNFVTNDVQAHGKDSDGRVFQSFAYIWLDKGNQNEFLKHPKIKWLDGGLEPPTSGLPVHCSTS